MRSACPLMRSACLFIWSNFLGQNTHPISGVQCFNLLLQYWLQGIICKKKTALCIRSTRVGRWVGGMVYAKYELISCSDDPYTSSPYLCMPHLCNRCWPNSFSDVCLHTRFLPSTPLPLQRHSIFHHAEIISRKKERGPFVRPFSRRGEEKTLC